MIFLRKRIRRLSRSKTGFHFCGWPSGGHLQTPLRGRRHLAQVLL